MTKFLQQMKQQGYVVHSIVTKRQSQDSYLTTTTWAKYPPSLYSGTGPIPNHQHWAFYWSTGYKA